MMNNFPLYYSEDISKSTATGHHIFQLLKMNQICPLVYSIFKPNSTSLQQVYIIEYVMNISLLEYMLGILYAIMNLCLKSVLTIFLVTSI
jgi:hypothetical protein